MKVLLFLPFPPDSPTGNAVTARRIRKHLAPAGVEVVLEHLPAEARIQDVIAAIERERPDLLQWYNAWKTGRWLPEAKRGRDLPSVITLTGTDINREAADPARRGAVLAALREADAIVTYGAALRDRVTSIAPETASKVHLLAKGVELGDEKWELPAWLDGDAILFLLPAGVRPEKGTRLAVKALDAVHAADPRVRLLLAGPVIDRAYHAELLADLAARPWAGHVEEIPHEAMASVYARSAVVLNTSLSEGLANAVLEAMACGRAVLASDVEGNRQVVRDGETGLLYRDEADLFEKARRLAADASLRDRLGRAARAEAEASFSVDREMAGLYRALLVAWLRYREDRRDGEVFDLFGWQAALASRWRLLPPEEGAAGPLSPVEEARCEGLGSDHATELTRGVLVADRDRIAGRVVWEVGCGTGVLAATCARLGAREVWATDVDERCLELARDTWRRCGVSIHSMRADLLDVDIRADVIVANLPQKPVPPGGTVPVANDGGPDGARHLLRLVEQAEGRLSPGGRLYLFLHSLAAPGVLDRLARGFEVELRATSTRPFSSSEFASLLPHWRDRRSRGLCFFSELPDGGGEFWCAVLSCVRR